jgi:signal peptidase II
MRILRIFRPLQGRTFSYKSHIKVVRFMSGDNLPARLRRFQYIPVVAAKRGAQSRSDKLMLIAIAAAAIVIAADQASKAFVLSRSWTANSNAGGFLSVRKQLTRRGPLMLAVAKPALVGLWLASIALAAVLLQTGLIADDARNAAGIGAALGGAAGNIADRLRRGAIVDFIAVGRWPLFNLADAAIVAGVGLLVLSFVER